MTESVSGANPYHAVPREVAEGFERMAAEESAVAARREAVAKLARPGQEERDLQLEIVMGRSPASDLGERRERSARLKQRRLERLDREDLSYTADLIGRVPIEFAAPEPAD